MPKSLTYSNIHLPAVLGFLALSGCVAEPYTVAWRTGATAAQASDAQTDCMVEGANRVPQSIASYTTPVYRTPSNIQCTSYGYTTSCYDYGGQVYGGDTRIYDANEELRGQVVRQCLARKGYSVVTFPACTSEQKKKGIVSIAANRLPPSNTILCATDGGYVLK